MDTEFASEFLDGDFVHRKATKIARSSETDAAIERQANRMASRILMPKCTFRPAYYNIRNTASNGANVSVTLAALYGVSRQAAEIRLKELGLAY